MAKQNLKISENGTDYCSDNSNFDCDFLFWYANVENINLDDSFSNVLNSLGNLNIDNEASDIEELSHALESESIWEIPISVPSIIGQPISDNSLLWEEELEISDMQIDQDHQQLNDCWPSITEAGEFQESTKNITNLAISKYFENSFDNTNRFNYWDIEKYESNLIISNHSESSINESMSQDEEIEPIFFYPTLLDEIPQTKSDVWNNNQNDPLELKGRSLHPRRWKPVRANKSKIAIKMQDGDLQAQSQSKRLRRLNGYFMASVETKRKAIELAQLIGCKEAANELNLSAKSIKSWIKIGPIRKKGGGRKTKDPQMEENLIKWYHSEKNKGKCMTIDIIKSKAIELSSTTDFVASKGWFDKFRRRFNILVTKKPNLKINIKI